MRLIIAAVLALLPAASAVACDWFVHEHDPDLIIHEQTTKVTVHDRLGATEYFVVITKPLGILISEAIEEGTDNLSGSTYQRRNVDGRDALIFDSLVFFAACPN